jgi:competence ComEA-like helix-hairpin-helix protein
MHEAETRALRRATVLLVVLSALRWGWGARDRAPVADATSVLPELLEASRAAADEESRRGAALAEGETIDPNEADDVELDRLPGVGPSTARAIVAAREGGTVFRTPEDLLAVPGIGPASLARIRDRLDLSKAPPARSPRRAAAGGRATPGRVDLNRADVDALQTLPGIGPAIAERIVAARKEQMFTSVEDLTRVRGVGPATVERLRPLATVGP